MTIRDLINLVVTEIIFDGDGQQGRVQARAEGMINPVFTDREDLNAYHQLLDEDIPREILDVAKRKIKKRLLQ